MQIFSRVALVRTQRQIYVSSLFARKAGRGQDQALDVFDQLQAILDQTGSDLRHMAKATYYVYDDRLGERHGQSASLALRPGSPPGGVEVHGAWRRSIARTAR